jgi:hypothetical protein
LTKTKPVKLNTKSNSLLKAFETHANSITLANVHNDKNVVIGSKNEEEANKFKKTKKKRNEAANGNNWQDCNGDIDMQVSPTGDDVHPLFQHAENMEMDDPNETIIRGRVPVKETGNEAKKRETILKMSIASIRCHNRRFS